MENSKNPTPGAKKIILKLHPRGKYFQKLREKQQKLGQKLWKTVRTLPLGQKNHSKTPPTGQIFSKIKGKTTKTGTEIMENSKNPTPGAKKSF